MAAAGLTRAVVKAGADGAYVLQSGAVTQAPAAEVEVADTTRCRRLVCGGVAAGLAPWSRLLTDAVALGVATAGRAIQSTGSLRPLDQTRLLARRHATRAPPTTTTSR